MRVLITGATGFAGRHLVTQLLADGQQIHAVVRQPDTASLPEAVTCVQGDLMDRDRLHAIVQAVEPDVVYHLAGQAYPGRSWQNPAHTLAINTGGVANLLEAIVAWGLPRTVIVTSAEIYGKIAADALPITESTLPEPRHPYGVSKAAAAQLVPVYWKRYGLPVVEARPFNHIGPDQALGFVVPDFASQLAAIKLGQKAPKMQVGNLSAERDFTDVRDVVRAYRLLAQHGQPGENYLICSGQPVAVHTILNILLEFCAADVEVAYDPARMRPSDVPILYGSFGKIAAQTNWKPTIHLRQTLRDVFDEWCTHFSP